MGRGSDDESERSDYRYSKQPRPRSHFDSHLCNSRSESYRSNGRDTRKPSIPTGPSPKRRLVAEDFFETLSPRSKASDRKSNTWVAPWVKAREPPPTVPTGNQANGSEDSRLSHSDTQPMNCGRQGEDATEPNSTILGERIKRSPVAEFSVPQQRPPIEAVSEALDGSNMDIDVPSSPVQSPKPTGEVAGTVTQFRRLHHDGEPKDNKDESNGDYESRTLLYSVSLHQTLVTLHFPPFTTRKENPKPTSYNFHAAYVISLQKFTFNIITNII